MAARFSIVAGRRSRGRIRKRWPTLTPLSAAYLAEAVAHPLATRLARVLPPARRWACAHCATQLAIARVTRRAVNGITVSCVRAIVRDVVRGYTEQVRAWRREQRAAWGA